MENFATVISKLYQRSRSLISHVMSRKKKLAWRNSEKLCVWSQCDNFYLEVINSYWHKKALKNIEGKWKFHPIKNLYLGEKSGQWYETVKWNYLKWFWNWRQVTKVRKSEKSSKKIYVKREMNFFIEKYFILIFNLGEITCHIIFRANYHDPWFWFSKKGK